MAFGSCSNFSSINEWVANISTSVLILDMSFLMIAFSYSNTSSDTPITLLGIMASYKSIESISVTRFCVSYKIHHLSLNWIVFLLIKW